MGNSELCMEQNHGQWTRKSPKPAPAPPPSATPAGETQRLHTTSPAATAESDAAAGIMSLAELQDAKTWKAKGVDPHTRELHLSDDDFQGLFVMDKGAFSGLPQWKKD